MSHEFTNLGGLEKPQDERDIKLGAAPSFVYTFPKTFWNTKAESIPIEYQREQPACGAHAGVELKDLALNIRFSPRFTWADIKSFDGFPIDSGTDMRSIFKSITKTGPLDYSVMGNDSSLSIEEYARPKITPVMNMIAARRAGMGYGFIQDLTFEGLKQFIFDHGPTIVLLRVGKEWWTAPNGNSSWAETDVLPLRPPKAIVSGHFVVAHSYDEKRIYFLNHWSDGWGAKGHGYLEANYMPFVNDAGALFPLTFKKDLQYGMTDPDVIDLQRYLNKKGFNVTAPGEETNYFGHLTQAGLKNFQAAVGISPAYGYFGPLTRAWVTQHA